jgi:hypothetical protein
MAEYYDLGSYHRPVSTASPEAQLWFDRGLIWCYGFHHEESIKCFKKVTEIDPDCAMAYWGHRLRLRTQLQQALGGVYGRRSDASLPLEYACRPLQYLE